MEIINTAPYFNMKMYGPYLGIDNRLRIQLVDYNGKQRRMSYPKFLMEIHLGRTLDIDETIDHIDKNPLNNEISNLQILSRAQHSALDIKRVKDTEATCIWCNASFVIKGSAIRNRNRKTASGFCSRKCSGQYGAELQNNRTNQLGPIEIERWYYTNKELISKT